MKKWKAIRDAFVKDHRKVTSVQTGQKASKQKRYVFYDQLQFLIPHVKGNTNTSSNIQLPITVSDYNQDANDTSKESPISKEGEITEITDEPTRSEPGTSQVQFPPPDTINPSKKRKIERSRQTMEQSVAASAKNLTQILGESLELKKQQHQKQHQTDKFGHAQFLSSFVPILDSLPLHAAMKARIEISEVVSRIVQGTYDVASRHSTPCSEFDTMSNVTDGDDSASPFSLSNYLQL